MTFDLPDISYRPPNLAVPDPPDGLPYAMVGDYYNAELLRLNGIELSAEALIEVLTGPHDAILQAASAHALGAGAFEAGSPSLRMALTAPEDMTGVEAANALARLGHEEGHAALIDFLARPVPPYLSPLIAAGDLAQLGDPLGFQVVTRAIGLKELDARMLACKQLFFFVPFHGQKDAGSAVIDLVGQFERALSDPDTSLHYQALAQLREIRDPAFVAVVRRYVDRAPDSSLQQLARAILERPSATAAQ